MTRSRLVDLKQCCLATAHAPEPGQRTAFTPRGLVYMGYGLCAGGPGYGVKVVRDG